jgi:hypothetical protein
VKKEEGYNFGEEGDGIRAALCDKLEAIAKLAARDFEKALTKFAFLFLFDAPFESVLSIAMSLGDHTHDAAPRELLPVRQLQSQAR